MAHRSWLGIDAATESPRASAAARESESEDDDEDTPYAYLETYDDGPSVRFLLQAKVAAVRAHACAQLRTPAVDLHYGLRKLDDDATSLSGYGVKSGHYVTAVRRSRPSSSSVRLSVDAKAHRREFMEEVPNTEAPSPSPLDTKQQQQEQRLDEKKGQEHKPRIFRRLGKTNITGAIEAAMKTGSPPIGVKPKGFARVDVYGIVYRMDIATPLHVVRQRVAALAGVKPSVVDLFWRGCKLTAEQKTLEEQGVSDGCDVDAAIHSQALNASKPPQVPGSTELSQIPEAYRVTRIYNGSPSPNA